MTLFKIIFVGVLIATALAVAKSQQWFERSGIVSGCLEVAAPAGARNGGQWWSCTKGSVTGYPSLARDGCTSRGIVSGREFWMCPTPLASEPF
jgi:hypothetical protein